MTWNTNTCLAREGLAAARDGSVHQGDRVLIVREDRVDVLLDRVGLLHDLREAAEDRFLALEVA